METDLGASFLTIRYKIVFIGDLSVGKTCILNRFIKNEFTEDYEVILFIFLLFLFYLKFSQQ